MRARLLPPATLFAILAPAAARAHEGHGLTGPHLHWEAMLALAAVIAAGALVIRRRR